MSLHDDLKLDLMNATAAKEIFRKMTTTTAYNGNFGDRPKAAQDFNILKDKQFSTLPSAQILKPHIRAMLNKWLSINDQDKFTGRIFFTIREMYTVVKNKLADVPTSHENHASLERMNMTLPRFDKMLTTMNTETRKQHTISQTRVQQPNKRLKSYFESSDFKIGSRHRDMTPCRTIIGVGVEGAPHVDTKAWKQRFLAGDKEAVLYQDPNEPKCTTYAGNHKGLQVRSDQKATILDHNTISFVGQMIPDPFALSKSP